MYCKSAHVEKSELQLVKLQGIDLCGFWSGTWENVWESWTKFVSRTRHSEHRLKVPTWTEWTQLSNWTAGGKKESPIIKRESLTKPTDWTQLAKSWRDSNCGRRVHKSTTWINQNPNPCTVNPENRANVAESIEYMVAGCYQEHPSKEKIKNIPHPEPPHRFDSQLNAVVKNLVEPVASKKTSTTRSSSSKRYMTDLFIYIREIKVAKKDFEGRRRMVLAASWYNPCKTGLSLPHAFCDNAFHVAVPLHLSRCCQVWSHVICGGGYISYEEVLHGKCGLSIFPFVLFVFSRPTFGKSRC